MYTSIFLSGGISGVGSNQIVLLTKVRVLPVCGSFHAERNHKGLPVVNAEDFVGINAHDICMQALTNLHHFFAEAHFLFGFAGHQVQAAANDAEKQPDTACYKCAEVGAPSGNHGVVGVVGVIVYFYRFTDAISRRVGRYTGNVAVLYVAGIVINHNRSVGNRPVAVRRAALFGYQVYHLAGSYRSIMAEFFYVIKDNTADDEQQEADAEKNAENNGGGI